MTYKMLFISPPFGNYIHLPHTMSIKGSYTLHPRPGLIGQIFKTLRYSKEYNGWINKIGLRNPGIIHGLKKYNSKSDIISIAIMNENEINTFLKIIPNDTNLELNVSCPNINKSLNDVGIERFLNDTRKWCIVKLSPLTHSDTIDKYYKLGFRQFHCCNTLPVLNGGVSGTTLIPYVNNMILALKKYDDVIIISGGGIRNIDILKHYSNLGATHFSVSTLLFNPVKFIFFYRDYKNFLFHNKK